MLEKEQNEIKESKDEHNKETENADEIHKMNGDLAKKYEINFPHENDRLDKFFSCIKYYSLLVNKLDTYGNAIPLGAFCFAIAFILIGFKDCKVNKNVDDFFNYIILIFGCIGQLIAGILEYIKGRTLPANLYLLYGIYFLSYYYFYYGANDANILNDLKPLYYGTWAVLSFPIFIGSVQSNVFYLVQTLVAMAFFVLRCIGEYKEKPKINETVCGILELITGFISLYIGVNQAINESFKFRVMPSLPLSQDNDIDIINNEKKKNKSN